MVLSENNSSINFEEVITVVYEPLAMFRVRPVTSILILVCPVPIYLDGIYKVTRCVETMPGHTDSILHLSYR